MHKGVLRDIERLKAKKGGKSMVNMLTFENASF